MPLPLQVKLLRFLQERVIERIGGRKAIPVDVRIVCATYQDLEAMIVAGRFREDLYYRLAEIIVRIPSLAARHGDFKGFTPAALTALNDWHWPGNVRELENKLKRAVIMAENSLLDAADLDLGGKEAASLNLKFVREDADRKAIRLALARTEGNLSTTSKLLGDSRPTLYDLLKQYGIDA